MNDAAPQSANTATREAAKGSQAFPLAGPYLSQDGRSNRERMLAGD